VSELLDASDGFRSAQDIHAELRSRGENVGLTTVYNQLRTLAHEGQVDYVRSDDGETLYRRCGAEHHHHLVCRVCGRTVEVQGSEIEQWADEVARANRYVDVQHTFEIVGTCHACARGRTGRRRS
jgi:Fur family ferric uptake transcriptional regulator